MDEEVAGFDFYIKKGLIGLLISLGVIFLITVVLLVWSLLTYSFEGLKDALLRIPTTSVDVFAILEGIIVFIALPIIIAIKVALIKKDKANKAKQNK